MNNYSPLEKMEQIREIASQIDSHFRLELRGIKFVVGDSFYGKCSRDGILTLKIEYSDGELIPDIEVWRTLAHEMAHLRHFNHDTDFWYFNREVLNKISEIVGRKISPEVAFTKRGVVY